MKSPRPIPSARRRPGTRPGGDPPRGRRRPPAQQWVTETRDPKQTQDEDFAKAYAEWTGEPQLRQPARRPPAEGGGHPEPKDVLGYHIGAPRKLTYYADILKYYRALAAATPRVKVETIGKSDEGPRARRRLGVVGREHQEPAAESRQPREARRSARRSRRADQAAHRDDQAALPPDGRPAQQRDRPVRDADGAGLPARDRDVAVHHRRFATTCTCRSRRSPTPTDAIATSIGSIAVRSCRLAPVRRLAQALVRMLVRRLALVAARAAVRRRRRSVRAAVLGQVRLPRQQPRH